MVLNGVDHVAILTNDTERISQVTSAPSSTLCSPVQWCAVE